MGSSSYPVAPSSLSWREERHIPVTPYQAIMESQPYNEPAESMLEKQFRLEPMRAVLESDVLTDRERWVIEAIFWRGRSLAQIGLELGLVKASIFRIRERALKKLEIALVSPPEPISVIDNPNEQEKI